MREASSNKVGDMQGWEQLLIGIAAILLILWFRPGIKAAFRRSQEAESDWKAVLIPIGLVVVFVIFLVMMV